MRGDRSRRRRREFVDLEVAGVDDDAERGANGERDAVDRAVGDGNKFDFKWVDFDEAAGDDFAERGGVEQAGFFEALFDERERKARAVNGHVDVAKECREARQCDLRGRA